MELSIQERLKDLRMERACIEHSCVFVAAWLNDAVGICSDYPCTKIDCCDQQYIYYFDGFIKT